MNINCLFETLNSVPTSITEEFNTEMNYPSSRFPQLEVKKIKFGGGLASPGLHFATPQLHTYIHNYSPI